MNGTMILGTGTLSGGSASFATSTLPVGTTSVTAVYGGDANFSGSTSKKVNQKVGKDTTTTTLLSSLSSPSYGEAVTFTAAVTPPPPDGEIVTFKGIPSPNTAMLSGGSASITTSALKVGTTAVTAMYGGDANLAASKSSALSQTVGQATTTTTLASSLNPSAYGEAVTFTASVAPEYSGTPTGTVTFYNGSTKLGTAMLSGGAASYTTAKLAASTETITAVYNGSSSFATSTSDAVSQAVNQATTTTALTSSLNPSAVGQSVTFTATVTPEYGGTVTGKVAFYDGETLLKSVAVSKGAASFTTSKLAAGAHSITATYNGSASFIGSTSSALTQTVE